MHWDHELAASGCRARKRLGLRQSSAAFPGRRRMGKRERTGAVQNLAALLRFMESPLSFFRMHWDHEPLRPRARRPRPRNQATQSRTRSRTTARTKGRFMESPLSFLRMHWDHEPVRTERRTSVRPAAGPPDGEHRADLEFGAPAHVAGNSLIRRLRKRTVFPSL